MNYNYLVPANSKKQTLIFGFLTKFDMILLGVGAFISFILLLILNTGNMWGLVLTILPVTVCAMLVFPVPNYHNVRIFIHEMYLFYFVNRRKYIWRGWCYKYEQSDE